jgi:hypothetical protein
MLLLAVLPAAEVVGGATFSWVVGTKPGTDNPSLRRTSHNFGAWARPRTARARVCLRTQRGRVRARVCR